MSRRVHRPIWPCLLVLCGCAPPTPPPAPAPLDAHVVDAGADAAAPDRSTPAQRPRPLPIALLDAPERDPAVRAGRAHQRAGHLGKARAAFEAGYAHDPSPALALLIGVLNQGGRAHTAALRWLARAEHPELTDFVAFRVLRSATALGDADGALAAAERIDPNSRFASHAARRAGRALLSAGEPERAQAWLDHWLAGRPPDSATDVERLRAEALAQSGRPLDAYRAWRRLALRHADGRMGEQALKAMRRIRWRLSAKARRAADAPDPEEAVLSGRADLDAHRYAALEARMLAALQAGGLTPPVACDVWWLLARARSRQREHASAAAAYRRFAEGCAADPRGPSARFAEARAWFTADDPTAALTAAEALWRGWPKHRLADDARLLAARIHLSRDAPDLARDRLRALLHHTPDGDVAADAAWLLRTLGEIVAAPGASDRAHVGRLTYFEGRDAEAAGDRAAALRAYAAVRSVSPSGYYGVLAAHRWRRLDPQGFAQQYGPSRPLPPPHLSQPRHREGRLLVDLGLTQDAWWAFDTAGSGRMEQGRFLARVAHLFAARGHEGAARRMFARDVPHLDGWRWQDVPAPWLDAVYPMPWMEHFTAAAEAHDLPLSLLLALAHTESRFDPDARSWAGACGPMQLLPGTARALARRAGIRGRITCRRLSRPAVAIPLAARYLADLRARFGESPIALAIAYNAGPGNARRWLDGDRPPIDVLVEALDFRQPRRYVKRVIAAMAVYEGRLTGGLPKLALD